LIPRDVSAGNGALEMGGTVFTGSDTNTDEDRLVVSFPEDEHALPQTATAPTITDNIRFAGRLIVAT
jgi:hypothetical protein